MTVHRASILPLLLSKGRKAKLSILSYGAGVDSHTILLNLIHDKDFRKVYVPNELIVVFSDTGCEHEFTYTFIKDVTIPLCKKHGIEFYAITPDMGYHSEAWQSLTGQWRRGKPTIGSVAFNSASCSHNLKLEPQYRFIEKLISERYKLPFGRKKGFKAFAEKHGKISWMIGIAKGEESRVLDPALDTKKWRRESVDIVYPLIQIGFDRVSCQNYINRGGNIQPMPSSCLFCHWASNDLELLWLELTYPDRFDEWCELEQRKLNANIEHPRNVGVCGRYHKFGTKEGKAVTLREALAEAKLKYPDADIDFLQKRKWSRGHCVKTKY